MIPAAKGPTTRSVVRMTMRGSRGDDLPAFSSHVSHADTAMKMTNIFKTATPKITKTLVVSDPLK
jgi:hypothetical protein